MLPITVINLTREEVLHGAHGVMSVASYKAQFYWQLHQKLRKAKVPVSVSTAGVMSVHDGVFTQHWDAYGNLMCTWRPSPKPVSWPKRLKSLFTVFFRRSA